MRFAFGDFTLDADRRELKRGAELISVSPKVFDLLVYFIENRERVVSKDELLETVWGGRVVSESTLTSHMTAARKAVGDTGNARKFIRTFPRKGFRFIGEITTCQPPVDERASIPAVAIAGDMQTTLPDKPSIAVLPFENLSGDPEQDYFADGVVEEIITALSRFRQLFVIARNSSFTYKGRAVDVKQIGYELGVRYVLEGSVRKSASRLRIAGQLVDTSTGAHLWADRFDGELEDIFDLEDKVTESVVGAIAPKLEQAEIERAKRKPTDSLDAYDLYLRGVATMNEATRQANSEALQLFNEAIKLDPEFASPYGMAAWCYAWRKMNGWFVDREAEISETARLARRAVDLGKDDAVALSMGGFALAFIVGDVEEGAQFTDQALVLNPNLAMALLLSGWVQTFVGEPEIALDRSVRAMRLSPRDPFAFLAFTLTGFCHFLAGRYDEGASWAEKGLHEKPNWAATARVLSASHALAGRLELAQKAVARLQTIDPAFRVSHLKDLIPFRRPEDLARFEDGLRKAGLPE